MLKQRPLTTALRLMLGSLVCALPIMATAVTNTTSFQVTLTVTNACTISATSMNFGSTYSIATAIDTTGTLTISCNSGTAYTVTLDAGTGTGSTFAQRKMAGPAASTIDYQIYKDATRTLVLADGTASTTTMSGTATGSPQTLTIYGRTATNAVAPAAGVYTSTVTATITY